jgi:hypothetical protein
MVFSRAEGPELPVLYSLLNFLQKPGFYFDRIFMSADTVIFWLIL